MSTNQYICKNNIEYMHIKNTEKAILGFCSPTDFINTCFGVNHYILNTWASFICLFTSVITNYIWDTAGAIYTLLFLMICDWATGIYLAIKAKITYDRFKKGKAQLTEDEIDYNKKRYFRSTRFPRMIVSMVVSLMLLSAAWWLSKYNSIYYFAPSFAYGGITMTYFISLIENCAEIGLFSKKYVDIAKEKLNPLNWKK